MNFINTLNLLICFGIVMSYMTPPVGFVNSAERSSSITGIITPGEARSKIVVIQQGVPVDSSLADIQTGKFILGGLLPGTYDIRISARVDGYEEVMLNHVALAPGVNTDLGRIELPSRAEIYDL